MNTATAPVASTPPTKDWGMRALAERARAAALSLAQVPTAAKNAWLRDVADRLDAARDRLRAANALDVEAGRAAGLAPAMLDRLTLTPARLATMTEGVRQVAALPDPVGELLEESVRPNGLKLRRVRVPIGVIGIVFESRPNVTVDCAALCFKSGNASILRGGKEALQSNLALAAVLAETLAAHGLPATAIQLVPTTDREALLELLKLGELVDCLIPRGGEGLIRFVAENARMPVIKHYKGVCSVYLHADADPAMAEAIVLNGKVSRPSVCNAIENLWVHQACAPTLLPRVAQALRAKGVELRAGPRAATLLHAADLAFRPATEDDYYAEFLDLTLAVEVVDDQAAAMAAIEKYGSRHSDAIVTADPTAAASFLNGVDSAAVFWNASTRFNDGFEFGLGAEIGISTDKLHARGPMGLRELTTYKWLVEGSGQVR